MSPYRLAKNTMLFFGTTHGALPAQADEEQSEKLKISSGCFILSFVLLFGALLSTAIDNDTWWLLSLGRSIFENGIPHTEPLSMHGGAFVAQQWLYSAVLWGVYNSLGYFGLLLFHFLCALTICSLYHRFCQTVGSSGFSEIVGILLGASFITLRPQILTYCVLLAELLLLEQYVRHGRRLPLLVGLPLLSVTEINLHGSTWPMMFIVMLPYVAGILWRRLNARRVAKGKQRLLYRYPIDGERAPLWPVLLSCLLTAAAGLLNPYGPRMMTYILRSFGVSSISENVAEMQPLSISFSPLLFAAVTVVLVAYFCSSRTAACIRCSHLCLVGGLAFMAYTVSKCVPYFLLIAVPVAGTVVPDVPVRRWLDGKQKKDPKVPGAEDDCSPFLPYRYQRVLAYLLVACAMAAGLFLCVTTAAGTKMTEADETGAAMAVERYIEPYTEECGKAKEDLKIYASYNTGGYLEFCGYRPYMDARAETFIRENNGVYDWFREWVDSISNPYVAEEVVGKYEFDVILTERETAMCAYLRHGQTNYSFVGAVDLGNGEDTLEVWRACQ